MFKKKKKDELMTANEMLTRLQKHGLKGCEPTWKDAAAMVMCGVVIVGVTVLLMYAASL